MSKWATMDAKNPTPEDKGMNLVGGEWTTTANYKHLIDPLTGKP